MNITVSWGQVITIAVTQAISTATTFYVMRTLGLLHNKEKKEKDKK
jgi:hypothetical protein